jgi:predicted alpha-1,2-mannosidase
VRDHAAKQWETALGRVRVDGGTRAQRTAFYTALYHSQLMPHDLTGENRWWHSTAPHYEDYFALWDTFRTLHPLLTLIQPQRQAAMVESLVDTYRHTGWLPDARVAGANGRTQVGSNGDVLVADAMVKALHGIDYRTAYRALIKDGEQNSSKPLQEGRELSDYARLGYLTTRFGRSASRTLEYAFDDFAIAQVAKRLGHGRAVKKYLGRARNWRQLWDQSSLSVRPRERDGSWMTAFDPDQLYPDGAIGNFDSPFYEGSARQWSTSVPHDVRWLIGRFGGDSGFTAWLDQLFDSGQYNAGNEPDLLAPYLYLHAGRPDRTADRVRAVLGTAYGSGRDGLPGNDDAGALSSWYAWSAMGLYPNAGQPFYYIGSPIFRRVRIDQGPGRTFEIDAPATSARNRYVRSATLGGRRIGRAWLDHREVARGGHLRLEMGPTRSDWATVERPPSL